MSYQQNGQRITTGKPKYPIRTWATVLDITTVEAQQKELRGIVRSYISDIKSARGFASTWTWRPFYGSLTLLHVVTHTHVSRQLITNEHWAVTFRHVHTLHLRDSLTSSPPSDPFHHALNVRPAWKQLGCLRWRVGSTLRWCYSDVWCAVRRVWIVRPLLTLVRRSGESQRRLKQRVTQHFPVEVN